jgi:hypothetical protein
VLLLRFIKSRSSRSQIPLFPLPGLCVAEPGGGVIRGGVGFEGPGARCATGAGVVGHVGCKAGGGLLLGYGLQAMTAAGGASVAGSADQRISCGWRSHGGAEARREQREESTTRPGGQLACPVLLLSVMLERPWLPTGVSTRAPVIHPVRVHK